MPKQAQYRRLLLLVMMLMAAFGALGYRLFDLQVLRHEALKKEADEQTKYVYRLEPRRGDILDAKGNLLATSVFVKTICADPSLISNRWSEVARALAPLLQTNEAALAQRLLPRTRQTEMGRTVPVQYVVLKRQVSAETWEKIRDTMSKLTFGVNEKSLPKKEQAIYKNIRNKGIFADPVDEQLRTYPNQNLASHVLGYMQERIGVNGIEASFEDKLKGVRGWRVSERDGKRRERVAMREQDVEPHDGLNVVLTIDTVIQHIVETALAEGMAKNSPVSISAVVVRPRTGEILAMATLPNFNPNTPGRGFSDDDRRNRVITDIAEPGSTFKIVVVSGALSDRTVTLSDVFDCENGAFWYAGKVLHDHERYGILTVENIIVKSSNIGVAKIALRMGEQRLFGHMRNYGFGDKTGISLPGEVRGTVHPTQKWDKLSIVQIPMGHAVAVTPLQMTMAMSAIANRGVLMRPLLVDRLIDEDGNVVAKYQPEQVRRVITDDGDKKIIEALKKVVTTDGTAAGAALEHYTVAGKTGTAQKTDGRQYLDKFYSSFVGFFPADNPEICIYVSLDDPKGGHYGGRVAAPVFKQIAEKAANYLNIPPDKVSDPATRSTMAVRSP